MAAKKTQSSVILGVETDVVKEYAKFFSKNDITYLHVKHGEVEVELKKGNHVSISQTAVNAPVQQTQIQPQMPAQTSESVQADETAAVAESSDDLEKVTSPIVGTFYTKPSPDSPPYVKIGDVVDEDSVVCIVEAMKMMNELKAGVKGKIAKMLVKDAEPVTAGQELFLIEKL